MIAPRILSLVAALVFAGSADLLAQQEPPVTPGDRVRVRAPTIDPDPLVGTFVALGADTCVLEVEGRAEQLALPLASVTGLEVYQGQQSWGWWKGALIGLLGGAAIGGGIAAATTDSDDEFYGLIIILGAGIGAGGGAFIGTGVGAAIKTDRWEPVPLDQLRVTIAPWPRGGLSVGVRVNL